MNRIEVVVYCTLLVCLLSLVYVAGKGDLLALAPKILTDRLKEINRKHGVWITNKSPVEVEYKCSVCGFTLIEANPEQKCDYKYCSMCGSYLRSDSK